MIQNKKVSMSDSMLEPYLPDSLTEDDFIEEFGVISLAQKGFNHPQDAVGYLEQLTTLAFDPKKHKLMKARIYTEAILLVEMSDTIKFHISANNIAEAIASKVDRRFFALLRYRSSVLSNKSAHILRGYFFKIEDGLKPVTNIVNMINGFRMPILNRPILFQTGLSSRESCTTTSSKTTESSSTETESDYVEMRPIKSMNHELKGINYFESSSTNEPTSSSTILEGQLKREFEKNPARNAYEALPIFIGGPHDSLGKRFKTVCTVNDSSGRTILRSVENQPDIAPKQNTPLGGIEVCGALMPIDAKEKHHDLEKILKNDQTRASFKEFLQQQFCAENLNFYLAVEEYKKIPEADAQKRNRVGRQIFERHFTPNSPESVNIDNAASKAIREKVRQGLFTLDIYDAAQYQIFHLLKYDCWPRYLRSGGQYAEELCSEGPSSSKSNHRTGTMSSGDSVANSPTSSIQAEESKRKSLFFWKKKQLPANKTPKRQRRNSSAPAVVRKPLQGNPQESPDMLLLVDKGMFPYTGPQSLSDEENMPPPRRSKRLAKQ